MAIGLLGGSFDPAHAGHLHIARVALRRLRLDQVWLLVSPGNPLKPRTRVGLDRRLAGARALVATERRIVATDIEARLGTRYTADTLRALRRRFPRARFVWIMGSDGLAGLPRWRHWMAIARIVPICVHARPGSDRAALSGQAAHRLAARRLPLLAATTLARRTPPAWLFLPLRRHGASSTALREAALGVDTPAH